MPNGSKIENNIDPHIYTKSTNQSAESTCSDKDVQIADSDIENLYAGNTYNFYSDKSKVNRAYETNIPEINERIEFERSDLLDKRRKFYTHHRWLIVESNQDNFANIAQAIANLVTHERGIKYLTQPVSLNCEEYILDKELYTCNSPSITKMQINDKKALIDFIQISENLERLTNCLQESKNILVLIVDSDLREQTLKVLSAAGFNTDIVYWVPCLIINKNNKLKTIEELNWLEKTVLVLCCWFYGLTFVMLHRIIIELLEAKVTYYEKVEQEKSSEEMEEVDVNKDKSDNYSNSDLSIFKRFLNQWQNEPDLVVSSLGLSNQSDIDNNENKGIGFSNPEYYQYYKQQISEKAVYHVYSLQSYVESFLIQMDRHDLQVMYPEAFKYYAYYLTFLRDNGLINLDNRKFSQVFESVCYSKTRSSGKAHYLIDLLVELHKQPKMKEYVESFVEEFSKQVVTQQNDLMYEIKFNIELINSLPLTLELLEKQRDQAIAKLQLLFKEKLYITFIIIRELGLNNDFCLNAMERILANNYGRDKANIEYLPSYAILRNQLEQFLTQNEYVILLVLKNLQFRHQPYDKCLYPEVRDILKEFCFDKCRSIVSHGKGSKKNQEFFRRLLKEYGGLNLFMVFFYNSERLSIEDAQLCLDTTAQFYLNILNDKESIDIVTEVEGEISRLLKQVAYSLEKQDFQRLRLYCREKVENSKLACITYRETKELRVGWKLNKKASIFIKQNFIRKKDGNEIDE